MIDSLLTPIHHYVSGEYKFIPGDTEERWNYNLKNSKDKLQKAGWLDRNFSYLTDSLGFRNNNDYSPDHAYNLFLGCSHTFGIGLPIEDVWVSHVSKNFETPAYNVGVPGNGTDTAFRILLALSKKIKLKNVFLLMPDPGRMEFYNQNIKTFDIITPWNNETLLKYFSHPIQLYIHQEKNLLAMENICRNNNASFTSLSVADLADMSLDSNARDLSHFGTTSHLKIAERFMESHDRKSKLSTRYNSSS